ncbi:sensor histidine kinase [Tenacibaculum jejuense]|uniref:histidine kinase n=1 Tax=Tenacibaculum jejuense TaxID=584609 RepID=A0A238U8D2_9FLAO|nr:ATP-binding protein [Tenacibaculum jejuense]SNR15305.1 Multi-sensor signal transduction histidine kinase [Tenacibaculum jejuense]
MNSLLKRQIRKYLPENLQNNPELEAFLDAVNKSYTNSDEQFSMLQRATMISSEELSDASEKLKKETDKQREIIAKLKNVITTLNVYELEKDDSLEDSSTLKLVDFIDHQTKEILKVNQLKDKLLISLEKQNEELNEYAHMVSHDLVSPLRNIETLVHMLSEDYEGLIEKDGLDKLKLISENVERIDILAGAIRNYSSIKVQAKKLTNLNMHHLLDDVINELKLCKRSHIHIANELPEIKVEADSMSLLFSHLIKNAVKFNDKELKVIEIGCKEEEFFWEFYVKDNGNGIQESYLKNIFMAFYKLENDYQSAGMGLSTVKKIVDMYEGRVWVESKPDLGSTFYFTIKKQ